MVMVGGSGSASRRWRAMSEEYLKEFQFTCPNMGIVVTADTESDMRLSETGMGLFVEVKCSCADEWHEVAFFIKKEAIENTEKSLGEIIKTNSKIGEAYDMIQTLLTFIGEEVDDGPFDHFMENHRDEVFKFHKDYAEFKKGEGR